MDSVKIHNENGVESEQIKIVEKIGNYACSPIGNLRVRK